MLSVMRVRQPICRLLLISLGVALTFFLAIGSRPSFAQQPNIVIINIDDMGWGDFGVYGSAHSQTPNINALASEGTRFTQFYSGAPICSPSRASLFTGQYAARSNITTFIDSSANNLATDNANHLRLDAPSIARTFHDNGYATGHFGKWHLGGGRDVGYAVGTTAGTNATAPRIVEYGYDEAWTQMEGLANRIINVVDYGGNANGVTTRPSAHMNGLNQQSEARGTGGGLDQLVFLEREFNASFMINRAIDFIDDTRAGDPNQPFFMNVWLDETHTPHDPPAALKTKYNTLYPSLPSESRNFLAVLEHADQQIGRLIDHIDDQGLGDDTLILVMADNGAVAVNANNINSTGPFRGTKGHMFEGGFRQPLIARWTGNVAANRTDTDTVIWMPDLFPTLTQIAGIDNPVDVQFDGENLSDALLGNQSQSRTSSLFWNMNRGTGSAHSNPNPAGAGAGGKEAIALRSGNWKLLINADGTAPELYDLSTDLGEASNLAGQNPAVVAQMTNEALTIRYSTPSRTIPDTSTPIVRLKAQNLASQGNGSAVSNWADTATGDSFNGTVSQATASSRPTVVTNVLNGQAVVAFDGNDSLGSSTTNSLPVTNRGITVLAVATGDTSGATAQRLGQIGDSGGAAGQVVGFDVSTSPTSTNNGGAGFRFNNGASLYDTPIADPGFHIVVWQIDDGQSYADAKLFVDGTLPINTFTGSSTSPTNTVSFAGSDLELLLGTGRSASGSLLTSDHFSGQLAEMLVFNEQLSIGQINLVANYLSTEYDLPFAYQTSLTSFAVADQNADGAVNAADYVAWRKLGLGGQQGYTEWRKNFGDSQAGSGNSLVPEPSTWVMMVIVAIATMIGRPSRRHMNHFAHSWHRIFGSTTGYSVLSTRHSQRAPAKVRAVAAILLVGVVCSWSHAAVMLSEIMYDPQNADTNREWIEIYNNGASAENIGGWQFGKPNVNAWTSAFPVGTMLNPGQALVITPSASTLDSDWGSGINRLQVSSFPGLPNDPNDDVNNATLAIRNASSVIQDTITYRDGSGWATTNGNDGNSIYVLPEALTASANDSGGNWRPSSQGVYGAYWRGAGGDSENHASPGFVASTPQTPFTPSSDAVWSMVYLPDTQNYVARPGDYGRLIGQMNWILNNKDAFNIKAVIQGGDIVNRNSGTAENGVTAVEQWEGARDAFHMLNGEVPYILAAGNHDFGITNFQSRETKYNTYFKATDNPLTNPVTGGILQGTFEPNHLENAYHEFTAPDGRKMLIFVLEYYPRQAVLNWADSIAGQAQYADHTAVMLTHSFIGSADQRWNVAPDEYPGIEGNDGPDMWNELVKVNGNFEMTFNGHIGGDQVGYRVDENDAGVDVHQMLLNAQFETNAGNGWLRVVEFLKDGQSVRIRTYSPHFDLYRTNAANQFNITITHLESALVWNEGTDSFSNGFARSDGELGIGVEGVDPYGAGGKEDLLVGFNGNASISGSASRTVASLRVGTDLASAVIAGRNGNGTVSISGSTNLTLSSTTGTGDLTVGEGGFTGTFNWNSSGTLTAQGKLRIGQGGDGVFNQTAGVVIGGNTAGSFKFLAIGAGSGADGVYNLNNGVLRPSGGFAGTEFRQTAVGDAGANGELNVGDGTGAANSAAVESNDDLFIGRAGGTGLMRVRSDGKVELRTSSNAAELLIGQDSAGTVIQTGGLVKSDNLVRIGSNPGSVGHYTISGGTLNTASDGSGTFQIGRDGASGTLRVEGTGIVSHGAELFVGDQEHANTTGRLEIVGSTASVQIGQLENAIGGASGVKETIFWQADAGGITPLFVTGNGPLASNRVQLQDPSEASANSGSGHNIQGDGIALQLELSAITASTTLMLINNQTTDAITGLFENASTMGLYGEGEQILGTGFNGTVNISYVGGNGNDVLLNLVAAGVSGDHNGDGMVDAADYVVWKKLGIDGAQGYTDWKTNFGKTAPGSGNNSNVPEPVSWIMIAIGAIVVRLAPRLF